MQKILLNFQLFSVPISIFNLKCFIILISLCSVNGYFEKCDQVFTLQAGETINVNSPYYPQTLYEAGSSCRYFLTAPSGYEINITCYLSMNSGQYGSCPTDNLYIARDGNLTLANANYYCGTGNIGATSLFNSLVMAYISSTTQYAGYFTCKARAQLQPCDCGWTVTSKVVNGQTTGVNEFPPMAGIIDLSIASVVGGGSIISYRYILTAAHVVGSYSVSNLGVLIGEHDYSIGYETKHTKLYTVASKIIHEYYDTVNKYNDIALLKTDKDITYSRGVGPVCLPFKLTSETFVGNVLEVPGWGTQSYGGPVSTVLKKVSLNVITNANCLTQYPGKIQNSQICTYTYKQDTCQNDSGGNLYYRKGRMYCAGIVSYGTGCATNMSSVNTRVTSHLNWITTRASDAYFCNP